MLDYPVHLKTLGCISAAIRANACKVYYQTQLNQPLFYLWHTLNTVFLWFQTPPKRTKAH